MKPTLPTPICAVQSITYTPERRVITFTRIAPHPDYADQPVKRRKVPFRLKLQLTPEPPVSFAPAIQVRPPAKP